MPRSFFVAHVPNRKLVHPGAVELLQNGKLPADHWDWTWGADFRFVKDEDADEGTSEHTTSASASAPADRHTILPCYR